MPLQPTQSSLLGLAHLSIAPLLVRVVKSLAELQASRMCALEISVVVLLSSCIPAFVIICSYALINLHLWTLVRIANTNIY